MIELIAAGDKKWNDRVNKFDTIDIYYLQEYMWPFQLIGDGKPCLFYYEDNGIKAINAVMLRDICTVEGLKPYVSEGKWYDISTPYGYGGFLIEGEISSESIEQMNREYIKLCDSNNIICEFVRFHPVLKNASLLNDMYDVIQLGRTTTMKLESEEVIWHNIASQNKNKIRKALKNNVTIKHGMNKSLVDEFIPMYDETMKRDKADDYYFFPDSFYKEILMCLDKKAQFFYALKDDNIIAMAIILHYNNQLHYHLSASYVQYRSFAPTNLLLYEAALWGSRNEYKTFHLGGGLGSKEDGLYNFKKVFNTNSDTTFAIGKKIFNKIRYDEFTNIVKKNGIVDTSFFPEYRA